jgi:hypothetical protein
MLTGSQTPTKLVVPEFVESEWKDCHAVNAAGGIEMLEWQDGIMEGWLGRNRLGRWTSPTCGGSLSRQNGKSLGLVVPRANYGMVMLGEEVLYTSHLQKTSTETFETIATFFDSKPLKKYVKDIKTALGREQVILKNGGRIKFLARTRNGGRGQHGSLLIFDEALELDADSQASFLPAISASKNPQVIYVSSPPTAQSVGTVFRGIRNRALSGESERLAWFEWSVDEIGDVRDKARWYATNPSLGILIQESTIESECEQMDEETFARERLGWWSSANAAKAAIDADSWDACKASELPSPDDGVVAYAVKFAPDGSTGALSACIKPDDGKPYVQCIAHRSMGGGVGWFADWMIPREDDAAVIVIDGGSYSAALVERLMAANFAPAQVVTPSSGDVAKACSMLVDAVESGELKHGGQEGLADSAKHCKKRKIGANGGYGFESVDGHDAVIIESCALALRAALTTNRDQRRKARVG